MKDWATPQMQALPAPEPPPSAPSSSLSSLSATASGASKNGGATDVKETKETKKGKPSDNTLAAQFNRSVSAVKEAEAEEEGAAPVQSSIQDMKKDSNVRGLRFDERCARQISKFM